MGVLYLFREKGLLVFSQKIRPEAATSGLTFLIHLIPVIQWVSISLPKSYPKTKPNADSPHKLQKSKLNPAPAACFSQRF